MSTKTKNIIEDIGLILIGICSIGYCIYIRHFAELHLQLPFLNFPIFIGEILIFVCMTLIMAMHLKDKPKWGKAEALMACYVLFILIKAFIGYKEYGPLALRHSALFYYPIFAVIGYQFYRQNRFNDLFSFIGTSIIILILFNGTYYQYFIMTMSGVAVVLILNMSNIYLKAIMAIFLLRVVPYDKIFYASRTMLLGNISALLFILVMLCIISPIKRSTKWIVFILLISLMGVGMWRYADRNAVQTLARVDKWYGIYKMYDGYVEEGKKTYYRYEYEPKIFNKDEFWTKEYAEEQRRLKALEHAQKEQVVVEQTEVKKDSSVQQIVDMEKEINKETKQKEAGREEKYPTRDLSVAYTNIMFRIFIWQDMIEHYWEIKPLFGIDFGYPFRSIHLEILRWAVGEWQRDGWISAHNSYLAMLYRGGIIGLSFIIAIYVLLFKMIKKIYLARSVTGVVLCGILIFWLVAANFLLIFELPYHAIPFWSLFGMTFAYLTHLQIKTPENNENINHT